MLPHWSKTHRDWASPAAPAPNGPITLTYPMHIAVRKCGEGCMAKAYDWRTRRVPGLQGLAPSVHELETS